MVSTLAGCGGGQSLAARLATEAGALGAKSRVLWDEALAGVRRFYTQDPWGNRIELLA